MKRWRKKMAQHEHNINVVVAVVVVLERTC